MLSFYREAQAPKSDSRSGCDRWVDQNPECASPRVRGFGRVCLYQERHVNVEHFMARAMASHLLVSHDVADWPPVGKMWEGTFEFTFVPFTAQNTSGVPRGRCNALRPVSPVNPLSGNRGWRRFGPLLHCSVADRFRISDAWPFTLYPGIRWHQLISGRHTHLRRAELNRRLGETRSAALSELAISLPNVLRD